MVYALSKSVAIFRIFKLMIVGIAISGCSSTSELLRETSTDDSIDPDYSIIYYIHADSDYLYHDSNGKRVVGNSKVLNTAHTVAKGAESGEVFIFYQRPVKKILGLFPRKSSQFYHYKNGQLTAVVLYRHTDKSEDFLTTESQIYDQYVNQSPRNNQKSHFLYFGHEIPLKDGKKYHRTVPDIDVNISSFTKGIESFLTSEDHRYNLIVLSTCNNGSPTMAENLMPISDTVIASPQNLHLSHIDTGSLNELEGNPDLSSLHLARSMAEKTFNRLESEILTAITLTVYDFDAVREYGTELRAFKSRYDSLNYEPFYSDNIDCREVEFFDDVRFSNGINTWYKPARFGRRTNVETHSGWGCRPLIQHSSGE